MNQPLWGTPIYGNLSCVFCFQNHLRLSRSINRSYWYIIMLSPSVANWPDSDLWPATLHAIPTQTATKKTDPLGGSNSSQQMDLARDIARFVDIFSKFNSHQWGMSSHRSENHNFIIFHPPEIKSVFPCFPYISHFPILPRSDLEAAQLQGTCWCLLEAPVAILVTIGPWQGFVHNPHWGWFLSFEWNIVVVERNDKIRVKHINIEQQTKKCGETRTRVCVCACVCSSSKGGIS